jgi:hypothetical protein
MLFRGWTYTKIARKLGRTRRAITYLVGCPEFDTIYRTYEAEQLAAFDRVFPRLLLSALDTLARLLRHPEASVRQRAVELIVEHTAILEKLAARPLDRPAGARPGTAPAALGDAIGAMPAEGMSDEQRSLVRQLLQTYRSAQPQPDVPSQLVSRVAAINGRADQN